jgi:hypothetical protein
MNMMHDGAPAHFSRAVRDVLNSSYHDRWTGRGGPTAWPPRSTANLNPPIDNEEALHHGIVDACQTISNYSGIYGSP